MEVVLSTQDNGLVLWDALNLVSPLPGDLDTSLHSLRTGVHRQDHVKTKELGDKLRKPGENVIVEGAGTKSQSRGLFNQRFDQLGVTVTLVDGRVGRKEVEVVTAFWIPDGGSLSASKDYG